MGFGMHVGPVGVPIEDALRPQYNFNACGCGGWNRTCNKIYKQHPLRDPR